MELPIVGELDQNNAVLLFVAVVIVAGIFVVYVLPPLSELVHNIANNGFGGPQVELAAELSKSPGSENYCRVRLAPTQTDLKSPTRIEVHWEFTITNYGEAPASPPGRVAVVMGEEVGFEKPLLTEYPQGTVLFGERTDFSFIHVFTTIPYNTVSGGVYSQGEVPDLKYKLVYCGEGCTDPVTQGQVFYENSTIYCVRG